MDEKVQSSWLRIFAAVFAVGVLNGCASLSKEECLTADWFAIGYEDGLAGKTQTRIGEHRRACAEHGVTPNIDQYLNGYNEGVRRFCTPRTGYNNGLAGKSYPGVCPADLEEAFVGAYRYGLDIWSAGQDEQETKQRLESSQRRLKQIGHTLSDLEVAVIAKGLTPVERAQLLVEIKDLSQEQRDIEDAIRDDERRLARLEERIHLLRRDSPY